MCEICLNAAGNKNSLSHITLCLGFNQIDRQASCATPSAANYSAIGLLYTFNIIIALHTVACWMAGTCSK